MNQIGWEPIAAIFATIVTLVLGIWNIRSQKDLKQMEIELEETKEEREQIEEKYKSLKVHTKAISIMLDYRFINIVSKSVLKIFETTEVDRFIMFYAINGKSDFRFVTCFYEYHKYGEFMVHSFGAIDRYNNVEVDDYYKRILKMAEIEGTYNFITEQERSCMVKDFYETEKVSNSLIKFLFRKKIDDENDIVAFTTHATHEGLISDNSKKLIKQIYSVIRAHAHKIEVHINNETS